MLRWFESTSSHQKRSATEVAGLFFVLELVGFEQVGRPKAANNSPADCCLDRGLANPPAPAKVLNVKTYVLSSSSFFYLTALLTAFIIKPISKRPSVPITERRFSSFQFYQVASRRAK